MAGVTGVFDDLPRFPQALLPVDALEGGTLTSSYPLRTSHHSLNSFAVVSGAVAIPGSDASRENALNGTVVESPEDVGAHAESL